LSETKDPLFQLLVRRARGEARASAMVEELKAQFGVPFRSPERVLTAMALVKTGATPESIASLMSWGEFEAFCAGILRANGYTVRSNIVVTKPRRQIDIFAESSGLALSVDCKHWGKGLGSFELERIATDQVERTRIYKEKRALSLPILPVIVTLLDAPARLALGVPIVPIFALRDFLNSISRFDEGLQMV
jgi:hypothetical protein